MNRISSIEGGATAPHGYRASGVHSGLKPADPDLALLVSDRPATAGAVFTTNRVQGAPVRLCRERLGAQAAQAVVVNSGNANACTGEQGRRDAERMAELAAKALNIETELTWVCSTGVIGEPLPMNLVANGIAAAATRLEPDGGSAAARAILTTDTVVKQAALEFPAGRQPLRLGGMAKGSGMIEPRMATMLAFLTTDADVEPSALQSALAHAVEHSFNKIVVDGDQSCNDTVLLMANGTRGESRLQPGHPHWKLFTEALDRLAADLAIAIVKDGEGATKFVTLRVRGAASRHDAEQAARTVARSLLVKTAWFGEDPNWGRIIDALGYSGAELREELVDISYDGIPCVRRGQAAPDYCASKLASVLKQKSFVLEIDLNIGEEAETVHTCDCSLDYVRINAHYTT